MSATSMGRGCRRARTNRPPSAGRARFDQRRRRATWPGYAPCKGKKTADDVARELLFTTASEREAHAAAVQALLVVLTALVALAT